MEIIVHYPKSEKDKRELERLKSALDAKVIGDYISKLDCPLSQKKAILDLVIDAQSERLKRE
ncbi:MAG TPA: hypothetical protein GXZ65_08365 [Clostridiales bacterium]|jgi:hypothetical protein|nr:hypothetical protein [Clostridiales bacterium]